MQQYERIFKKAVNHIRERSDHSTKAWALVNNKTATVTSSYNVASITQCAVTNIIAFNFKQHFASANSYVPAGNASTDGGSAGILHIFTTTNSIGVSALTMQTRDNANGVQGYSYISVVVVGRRSELSMDDT